MKKVLLIADTYYPDSRATIMIAQRIAEEMVKRGYTVEAVPLHMENKNRIPYPREHNSVSILQTSAYSCVDNKSLGFYKKLNRLCYRIALAPKKLLVKTPKQYGQKWNEAVVCFTRRIKKVIYEKPKKSISLFEFTGIIRNCLQSSKPDIVISVALPFDIHYCVSKAIRKFQVEWIPTCFDPYAYDEILDKRESEKRRQRENHVYKTANAVFMLSQFRDDYAKEKLNWRVRFVELPNIRPLQPSGSSNHKFFSEETINCAFIGNLYGVKRNPGFVFDFFERMTDQRIHLYVIGSLIDISKDDVEDYRKKMNDRLHYLGRVGQQEAIDAMFEADVLVNVGHTTTNQCPSKVLDYMSTGKPILHISKNENCSSLPYLKEYLSWFHVDERKGLTEKVIQEAESFVLASKERKRVPFEQVQYALPNCTIEKYVDTIESCINE